MLLFSPLHVETSIAQYAPVFFPGENPWQRSLTGHSLQGHKELGTAKVTLCALTQDFFAWGTSAPGTVKCEGGAAAWLAGNVSAQSVQVHKLPPPQELWTLIHFSRSVMSDYLWPHGQQHARLPCLITNSWSLLNFMSIESMMPSNHLILFHPLLLLPSIFAASGQSTRVSASASVLPKNI